MELYPVFNCRCCSHTPVCLFHCWYPGVSTPVSIKTPFKTAGLCFPGILAIGLTGSQISLSWCILPFPRFPLHLHYFLLTYTTTSISIVSLCDHSSFPAQSSLILLFFPSHKRKKYLAFGYKPSTFGYADTVKQLGKFCLDYEFVKIWGFLGRQLWDVVDCRTGLCYLTGYTPPLKIIEECSVTH